MRILKTLLLFLTKITTLKGSFLKLILDSKKNSKRDDSCLLRKHYSFFKIDVLNNKKTGRISTRKISNLKNEDIKDEVHQKLRKITHEYSDSTNANSKESSTVASINEKLVTKFDRSLSNQKNRENLVPQMINKSKKLLRYVRNTRNNKSK